MGNVPSRNPKAELHPYLGYGVCSPTTPHGFDEKDTIFWDILDQPLVASDEARPSRVKQRKSWGSVRSSSSSSSRRISLDSAFDAARGAWGRVLPPRRRSYHKVYENERGMIGIEWAADEFELPGRIPTATRA